MLECLIIADDFTGALDTGVQFAAKGAVTQVTADCNYDFAGMREEIQVLVVDTESRHLSPQRAYDTVFRIARNALNAGNPYLYKKTDSGLRGNIGAELKAVMDAADKKCIPFIPAFPEMNRITKNGIHFVDGVPVAESVFGKDPFEPVKKSKIAEIIAEQITIPAVLHTDLCDSICTRDGIHVFDAAANEDLKRLGTYLNRQGMRISAGCAGFGAVLADSFGFEKALDKTPVLPERFLVVCGSINPVTLAQIDYAKKAGFPVMNLSAAQKLDDAWGGSAECEDFAAELKKKLDVFGRCIVNANETNGEDETKAYAAKKNMVLDEVRTRIANTLSVIAEKILDSDLDVTVLCSGGDVLTALMKTIGISELMPICELDSGCVLTCFSYGGKTCYLIAKSGGFGSADLLCRMREVIAGGEKE